MSSEVLTKRAFNNRVIRLCAEADKPLDKLNFQEAYYAYLLLDKIFDGVEVELVNRRSGPCVEYIPRQKLN